ncbi:unnamed protein product, partial [Rotaria socialis]
MSDNQNSNNTGNLSFAGTEISMSRTARFWILLLFDIPSIICTLFVLCCILMDRKLRSSVKNHSLVLFLILGLGTQLVDVPFYLNFIVHSSVVPANPSICILWWFTDIGMYNGGAILLAWTAFERHIIIFHDRWISTRKRRIIVHYLPLLFLILYIFIYYIYAFYAFPCENTYDYTLPYCDEYPCYANDPIMGMFDWIVNIAMPTLLEAFFSVAFMFRVVWQKYRSRLPVQWRKQRKMTIQLMSLTALNLSVNCPLSILNIAYLCARCHTNLSMDTFLSQPTDHNHAPSPERIPVIELHSEIKARAVTSEESTSVILHSSLRTLPLSATSELPRTEMLKQTIRRQRQTPATTSTDDLTDDLRKTYRGEDFLLHEEKDMIIFTTKSNLSALKQSKHWFADGTFKVCPNDLYQLFTLHALMTSTIIPLVYGLLIGKSSNDYNGFFRKVLDQGNFQPETILSDFETGTIKTIKDMLPNVTHKGCLFHFGQSVWRHVQNKGLSAKYKEDENFRLNVKMLIGLAYLPLSDVKETA